MARLSRVLGSLAIGLAIGLSVAAAEASTPKPRTFMKLADGVFAIEHADAGDGFASGNTLVVIGDRQVLVVDTCFLPSAAREDIAQIRQWTGKPVSFVVNTHFHNDHNLGNRIYMEAFPALTIIAHVETKRDMDRFGPGSAAREEATNASLQRMLETGKSADGKPLSADDKAELEGVLPHRTQVVRELKDLPFQSATLTFDHDFSLDLGNREVQIKFLGRGNTSGDAIVYLQKEKILATGDLVVRPIPYVYDGYPSEWVHTMERLSELDADTIVPGHGPVMHDKASILLIRDLLRSAVEQLNVYLEKSSPAMFQTLEQVQGSVDLTGFRDRFAGDDKDLVTEFDQMSTQLIGLTFSEARLR